MWVSRKMNDRKYIFFGKWFFADTWYDFYSQILSGTFEILGNVQSMRSGYDLLRCFTHSSSGPWLPNSIDDNVTSNVWSAHAYITLILNMEHDYTLDICMSWVKSLKARHRTKQTRERKMPTLKLLFMATRAIFRNSDAIRLYSFHLANVRFTHKHTHTKIRTHQI